MSQNENFIWKWEKREEKRLLAKKIEVYRGAIAKKFLLPGSGKIWLLLIKQTYLK